MAVAADSELQARAEPRARRASSPREGNVVPVRARFVDDCETPVSAFLKLRAGEPEGAPCFLLESAEQGQVGRYSFVGLRPRAVLRWSDGVLSEWSGDEARRRRRAAASRRPIPTRRSPRGSPRYRPAPVEGLPPFAGGAVGFFGYDLVRTVEPLGEPNPDPLGLPDMALMVTDVMLVFDHLRHELTILACAFADDDGGIDAAYERAAATIAEMRERLRGAGAGARARRRVAEPPRVRRRTWSARSSKPRSRGSSSTSTPATPSRSSPRSASRRPAPVEAFSIYRGLRAVNPSPYMYFLEFGDFQIAGASPEPLVKVTGDRVETRPIAGTYPRGAQRGGGPPPRRAARSTTPRSGPST